MSTISEDLIQLNTIKNNIKSAIVGQGVSVPVGTKFEDYSSYINLIKDESVVLTAVLSTSTPNTLSETFSAYGTGVESVSTGNPGLSAGTNAAVIIDGELVYEGNLGVPAVGKYIPIASIKYKAKSGGTEKNGYFALVRKTETTGAYAIVDKKTGTNMILSSSVEYDVTMRQGIIFRDITNGVLTGSSSLNNAVFGVTDVTNLPGPGARGYMRSASTVYPETSMNRNFSIPTLIKNKITSGYYNYVTISAEAFQGTATVINGIDKGAIALISNIITF